MDRLSTHVFNQHHPKKPIKYWAAYQCGKEIDRSNFISLLKHKYDRDKTVTIKAVY